MNYDDYADLRKEEAVRQEMLEHTAKLRELASKISKAQELQNEIKQLHYKIAYWGL